MFWVVPMPNTSEIIDRRVQCGSAACPAFALHDDLVPAVVANDALRLSPRQRHRRHVLGVVDAPGDQRQIRIASLELDDHFLPDVRDEHPAPALAAPVLRHADPARALVVALAVAIPVEVHLHAAELVGVDVLA